MSNDQNRNFTVDDFVAAFPNILSKRDAEVTKAFTVHRVVGSGVSGTAFLVNRAKDNKNLIAKVTNLSSLSPKKQAYARSEVQCLRKCNHFAIIKHVGDFETENGDKLLLLMELADAGDLGRQVKHRARALQSRSDPAQEGRPTYFKEHEVAFLFLQVVLAVHDLHRQAILHRDIKSANVFLMSVGIVKLGDLGFSQVYEATVSAEVGRTFCGTPYYLAPELWRRHRYSKKADVWSLGVLLYEMAALKRPFAGDTMLKLFDRIMTGRYDPLPDCYSRDLCDLVDSILVFDPEARPATGDILRNKYMQFVMSQFERTIQSGTNQFSPEEKTYILDAVSRARQSVNELPASVVPTSQRSVVKKAIVLKQSANMWKQRFIVFDGHVLTVSAVEQTVGQTRNLELHDIATVNVSLPEVGRQNCFTIVLATEHGGGVVHFQERSAEEAVHWVALLTEALERRDKQTAEKASEDMNRERIPDRALGADSPTNVDGEAPGPFPTLAQQDSLSPATNSATAQSTESPVTAQEAPSA